MATIAPSLCQVAIVTLDTERSLRFYSRLLGLDYAGSIPVRGALAARMFGVPRVEGECHWLCGKQPFFQVEVFRFREPQSRPRARPHDAPGYQRLGIEVADLDATLAEVESSGGERLTGILEDGGSERAWVRDPDGVLIELRPRKRGPPRLCGVAAVVGDLSAAVRYFSGCLGLPSLPAASSAVPAGGDAGGPCPPGARVTLQAGAQWLELHQYPSTEAIEPAPQTGLTDRGLMNIALGVRRPSQFNHLYRRVLDHGYECATEPIGGRLSHAVYVQPTCGLSVELLQLPWFLDPLWGFRPPGPVASAVRKGLRLWWSRQSRRQPPSQENA